MRRAIALAALALALTAGSAHARTRLEGEYVFQVDLRKQDRFFEWDFDSNNNDSFNQIQFRLLSDPISGVDAFLKFEAEWNSGGNGNLRPLFQYRDAHLHFRRDLGRVGIDSYLFSRQDRFWVDNYLIKVVEGGAANDGGNAQGARIDLWGPGPTNITLVAADFSSQSQPSTGAQPGEPVETDDAYVARLRRELFHGKLRAGMTWNRKNTRRPSAERITTQVLAGDLRVRLGLTDVYLEYAEGRQSLQGTSFDGDPFVPGDFRFSHPEDAFPDHGHLRAEIRALRVGAPRFGYFHLAPSAWYIGPRFANALGNGNKDETGYYLNSWFLVPGRAITFSNNYLSYTKRVDQSRHVTEWYSELYVEFVKGFTGKLAYRNRTTRDWIDDGGRSLRTDAENDDVFAEMQVENRLAWLRTQFRIRDLDTAFQKELASIEAAVNLTTHLKIYNRFTFGNDPARVRKGIFSELQYRPSRSLEIFLAYGPFWIGSGSNPVYEGNLEGSGDNKDLIRLTVKGTF